MKNRKIFDLLVQVKPNLFKIVNLEDFFGIQYSEFSQLVELTKNMIYLTLKDCYNAFTASQFPKPFTQIKIYIIDLLFSI